MIFKLKLKRRELLKFVLACAPFTWCTQRAACAVNTPLAQQINAYIQKLRTEGRIAYDERTAWSVYDFMQGQQLVDINAHDRLQCASMMKPFVVLAYFYMSHANPRDYPYSHKVKRICELMIVKSSNNATNSLMRLLGGPGNVQYILQRYSRTLYRGLELVEYIPKGGRTYRNRATARDYQQFLYALWHKQMPMAAEMQRLMRLPNHDRLHKDTVLPDWINVYDKTGSTSMMCGNMGILELSQLPLQRAYAFVGIIEKAHRAKRYNTWITKRSQVMREVSEMTYFYLSNRQVPLESLDIYDANG